MRLLFKPRQLSNQQWMNSTPGLPAPTYQLASQPCSPSPLLTYSTSLQAPLDPIHTLELLGENLDDDFLLLLPSNDQYELQGFVTCFPAGFNTKEKFGMKLREVHTPVPGYKEKLEKSMDRFFDRLEVGRVVQRSNVSYSFNSK